MALRPSSTRLCAFCDRINIENLLQVDRRELCLGAWGAILDNESDCSFCRLVVRCVESSIHDEPLEDATIMLENESSWTLCVATSEYEGGMRSHQYTNKYDLLSGKRKIFSGNYDKRIIVSWNDDRSSAQIQIMVPDRDIKEHGTDQFLCLGRQVRPMEVNFSLLRHWLNLCEDHHGLSCCRADSAVSRGSANGSLRFIDTYRMCIVTGKRSATYAIMSYVWGESRMHKSMPRTLQRHKEEERLNGYISLPDELPLTIRDSIVVARSLGYRYLWNDALCIIQDDEKEREAHVAGMDEIYRNADLTIMAGSGRHAGWGLPGISIPREQRQHPEFINGHYLTNVLPSYNELQSTTGSKGRLPINRRGWTFQEKILSRRILLFTKSQIYFRCKNASWCEDTIMEIAQLSKSVKRRSSPFAWGAERKNTLEVGWDLKKGLGTYIRGLLVKPNVIRPDLGFLPSYLALVQAYTLRKFTYPADRLNAISGVLNTLEPRLGRFYGGLPEKYFREALLWRPVLSSTTIRQTTSGSSWSWVGWEFQKPPIWDKCDLDDTKSLVNRPVSYSGESPRLSEDVRSAGSSIAVYTRKNCHIIRSSDADEFPTFAPNLYRRYPNLLCIKTVILTFNIRTQSPANGKEDLVQGHSDKASNVQHDILDTSGNCIGHVLAPYSVTQEGDSQKHKFLIVSWGRGLFNAIAESQYIPTRYVLGSVDPKTGRREYEVENMPPADYPVANVLLVTFDEHKTAQRMGIGKIVWTALAEAEKSMLDRLVSGGSRSRSEWVFL